MPIRGFRRKFDAFTMRGLPCLFVYVGILPFFTDNKNRTERIAPNKRKSRLKENEIQKKRFSFHFRDC